MWIGVSLWSSERSRPSSVRLWMIVCSTSTPVAPRRLQEQPCWFGIVWLARLAVEIVVRTTARHDPDRAPGSSQMRCMSTSSSAVAPLVIGARPCFGRWSVAVMDSPENPVLLICVAAAGRGAPAALLRIALERHADGVPRTALHAARYDRAATIRWMRESDVGDQRLHLRERRRQRVVGRIGVERQLTIVTSAKLVDRRQPLDR
jgi:hypothetical protein